MKFKGIPLTEEQENVIDLIKTGEDTKVQAPAGSGKTFVLEAAASAISDRTGLYLSFNKSIADEATKRFGRNVKCQTTHSLAFQTVGKKYVHRLGKITGAKVTQEIGITNSFPFPSLSSMGYIILDTIKNFCYSNDPKISTRVVPKIKMNISEDQKKEIQKDIANDAAILWEKMKDENSSTPITHDFYLKLWALSKPQLNFDFLLLDEAQDLNPVILGLFQRQNAQKIFVGDQYQQIYSWRGSINALQRTKTKHTAYLTQSFRFGHEIAELASDILQNYMDESSEIPPRIKGFKERDSKISYSPISDPNCIICRTNNGVINNVFYYLEQGKRVYVQGGTKQTENLLKGAMDLMQGKKTWVTDLCLFSSWGEVVEYTGTESGSDLRGLVSLVNKYPVQELIMKLQATLPSDKGADIVLTTGHKIKGREFSKVKMYSDFPVLTEEKTYFTQEETNLFYVGVTRALNLLDISKCPACQPESLYRGKKKEQEFFIVKTQKYPKIQVKGEENA